MRSLFFVLPLPLVLLACPAKDDTGDTGDTSDTADTADTADTTDTADTSGDSDTADTSGDSDTSGGDTGDTNGDDTDVDDTSDTSDTDPDDTGLDSGDSGGDTADSGGDTGDSGMDTGDPDTGDSGGACTARDLEFIAEVRDSTGAAGTKFAAGEALTMVGIARNPCAEAITFTTPDSCLVTSMSLTDSSGMGEGIGWACADVVTTWTIPAGGSEEVAESWGRVRAESYQLDVSFNLPRTTASTRFVVR